MSELAAIQTALVLGPPTLKLFDDIVQAISRAHEREAVDKATRDEILALVEQGRAQMNASLKASPEVKP